jgi:diguanylate cyclase (GGDEF)-like protein/PAS domain S-box-containing protein
METELRESELAHRTLAQNLPGMVYRVHLHESGRMQFYNDMPVQITGYAVDELMTGAVCSIEPLIVNEDRPGVEAEVMLAMEQKRAYVVEYRLKHKDGGIRWMEEHGMPVYGTDSAPLYIDGMIFDITEDKQAEINLQLFRTLLDNSSDAIEVIDPATLCLLDVNETECRDLGYSREELLTMSVKDIETKFTTDQMQELKAQILQNGEARFESMHRRKDETTYPVEIRAKLVEIGKPYMLSIVRDITERRLAEAEVLKLQEQLREQANHDSLTGLYNRRYLEETMGREIIRAERYGQPIGVVMCDLDHFKLVNDTYGHLVGDEVLRASAELLRTNSRGSDIVCRFGGEEFLLLLFDMSPDIAYQRAEELRASLAAQQIGKSAFRVTASFGVASYPVDGKTQDALISAVDAAMYQAKKAGRNRVVVASAHEEDVPDRTEMGSAEVSRRKDKRRPVGH